MPEGCTLSSRTSNHDLHIRLTGTFEESLSEHLRAVLQEKYNGQGRLFLDVRELAPLQTEQQALFRTCLADFPSRQLFFKGQNGFDVGINGSRVLIMKKKQCSCNGKCTVCTCARRAENRQAERAEASFA